MLENVETKIVEKSSKNTIKRLLYCLLRIISSSKESHSVKACERLLAYMKRIDLIFESFRPTTKLIQQLNIKRLLKNDNSELVWDFIIFILRYYPDVSYKYFKVDESQLEDLKREEVKRVWDTVHSVLKKIENVKGDMKSRSVRLIN